MATKKTRVLFVGTSNGARSLMALTLLRHWGGRRFEVRSGGLHPSAAPHPIAIRVLEEAHLLVDVLKPSSIAQALAGWNNVNFVFRVSPVLAGEAARSWPGHPIVARWNVGDPGAVGPPAALQLRAFRACLREIEARVKLFAALPLDQIDRRTAAHRVRELSETNLRGRS